MNKPSQIQQHALDLLREKYGPTAVFREGQWEAIEAVAVRKERTLVVQRTGWGKSLVYFLATKLLREEGAGPTLLICPLLSLMRNQIEMAGRIGIRANTINYSNHEEWDSVEEALVKDECDLLLITPEHLNSQHFLKRILPLISGRIGLFVVDEAHCISDWGHDFRTDYRRIVRILQMLPKNIPMLGTTATANNRVIDDVQTQLGREIQIYRGSLARESLRLQNIRLASQSERMAWLAENLPKFQGSGIVYCLTKPDTDRVTTWLKLKGFKAEAYYASDDKSIDHNALEQAFLKNEIKILVATVALGMGFDKPDIEFVIHFQRPASVIAYYQQVGRAGRALEKSYGILLSGEEDEEIQDYFIESAFPHAKVFEDVMHVLEAGGEMAIGGIQKKVNASLPDIEKALKLLVIDGAVGEDHKSKKVYFRTTNPWKLDAERIEEVTNIRREEQARMQDYLNYSGCLMEFLLKALDDPTAEPCGRCANCKERGLPTNVAQGSVLEAVEFLKGEYFIIEPRKQWPIELFPGQKKSIPSEMQNAIGRTLCAYGDSGWGKLVRAGKYQQNSFGDDLVEASAKLIREVWRPDPCPQWVTAIPSNRHLTLVPEFAAKLAAVLSIPFIPVLERTGEAPEQKSMQNSYMQARNVRGTLGIKREVPSTPVLLVDDIIDSGWTLTMAGYLLREHGSGLVYPFTLARASGRN